MTAPASAPMTTASQIPSIPTSRAAAPVAGADRCGPPSRWCRRRGRRTGRPRSARRSRRSRARRAGRCRGGRRSPRRRAGTAARRPAPRTPAGRAGRSPGPGRDDRGGRPGQRSMLTSACRRACRRDCWGKPGPTGSGPASAAPRTAWSTAEKLVPRFLFSTRADERFAWSNQGHRDVLRFCPRIYPQPVHTPCGVFHSLAACPQGPVDGGLGAGPAGP